MNIAYNLLNTGEFLLILLLTPLPDTDPAIVSMISSNMTVFIGYLQTANFFFPVTTLGVILTAIFSMETGLLTWKLIKWIASIISIGIIKQ